MAKIYGVGIMGAGNISSTYLRLAPQFKGIEVRGVADIVPEAAARRSEEFGAPAMTPDEMLESTEIEVIVNLTSPSTHYSVSMDAVTAGKHVYSEKPFALTVQEGLALKNAADLRGLLVGSAPDTFLGGAHQQVRKIVDSGQIGKITHGTAHVMSRGMEHWHPNPEAFFRPGAGPILDMGPYYITDLVHLIGPVKRVTAFANSGKAHRIVTTPNVAAEGRVIEVGTPTTVHGVLEFHSGALITIGASWDTCSHGHHNIELYGAEGSIFVPDPNFFGGKVQVSDQSGVIGEVDPWDHPFSKPNQGLDTPTPRANYRTAGLADMVQALDEGRPPRCGLDIALHVVDVMTSLLEAADAGKVIRISTTCERPEPLTPEDGLSLLE